MADAEVKIEYTEPKEAENTVQQFRDLQGQVRTVSSVPDWTPTKISEQYAVYVSGTDIRYYFYDYGSSTWRFVTDTTLAKSGSTALRGDVTFTAGGGITLTQSGQNIDITSTPKSYFQGVSGSYAFAAGGETTTTTITPGFQAKYVRVIGQISKVAISTVLHDLNFNSSSISPSYWDGTNYLGWENNDGVMAESGQSMLLKANNGLGEDCALTIASVTSTQFNLSFAKSGIDAQTFYWKFLVEVYG